MIWSFSLWLLCGASEASTTEGCPLPPQGHISCCRGNSSSDYDYQPSSACQVWPPINNPYSPPTKNLCRMVFIVIYWWPILFHTVLLHHACRPHSAVYAMTEWAMHLLSHLWQRGLKGPQLQNMSDVLWSNHFWCIEGILFRWDLVPQRHVISAPSPR